MFLPKCPKWMAFILKNVRKIGLVFSFTATTYKAFDYRRRFLNVEDEKVLLHEKLDASEYEVRELTETYNNVLLKLSLDSYQMDDIVLPFWYKIYDPIHRDFKMVRFNNAYQEKYGASASEYFGKADKSVVGDIGEEYLENDLKAFESGKMEIFYERYLDKETGTIKIGKYAKWRIDKPSGQYIFGLELDL